MAETMTPAERLEFLKDEYQSQLRIQKRLKKQTKRQTAPTTIIQQNQQLIASLGARLRLAGLTEAQMAALESEAANG